MRRSLALVLLLSSLACHRGPATRAPASNPAAELDALIARIDEVALDPRPGLCEELDAVLAALGETAVAQKATYARAEAALRCDHPERWQALHESLARTDYMPSLVRLADDAVEGREWDRALAIVERIAERSEEPGEAERMQRLELQLIHARWIEGGDAADFATLERAAKDAIARDPKQLEARAALIRLHVERAAITGSREPLILAQISEREARRVAAELALHSPVLELVSGLLRELEGDRAAAVVAWTRALELNAALVEPRLWLGLAAIDRRDFASAQTQLQAFVDVHPTHVGALLALGVAARGAGDLEAADRAYARAIELDDDDPRPHWNRAMAHDPWRLTDDDGRLFREQMAIYEDSLRSFAETQARIGPHRCAARGSAEPDPACLHEQQALAKAEAEASERLEIVDDYWEGQQWICKGSRIPEIDEEQERQRRQRLLELERLAAEADGRADSADVPPPSQ